MDVVRSLDQDSRVIIAGGRDFFNVNLVCKELKKFRRKHNLRKLEVVSGTARGADRCGERAAHLQCLEVVKFPAQWSKYGKSAGHRRNREMAEYSTHLLAFWDGESRGTKNMIKTAMDLGLIVEVVRYDER